MVWMCLLLGVPRSSFYAWASWVESARAVRRQQISRLVEEAFHAGRGAYGCRRITAVLNRAGHPVSVGMVADVMRELGLKACQPRLSNAPPSPVRHRWPVRTGSDGTSPPPCQAPG